MSTQNANDSALEARVAALEQQLRQNPLRSASVERGRVRFYAGSLLLIEDSNMQIRGEVYIDGTLRGDGTISWDGPAFLNGPVHITGTNGTLEVDADALFNGDVSITKTLDVSAETILRGLTQVLADLRVENNGRVVVGGVTLTPQGGGRILIGTGSSQIILDTTQFKVGSAFRMDPAHSTTGAQMEFGTGRLGRVFGDDSGIVITAMENGDTAASFLRVLNSFEFTGVDLFKDVRMSGLESLPSGTTAQYVVADENGKLWISPGVGGGGGVPTPGTDLGRFQWPFDPNTTVTSEYGPRWGRMHEGIDFGISPAVAGAPIIAAGDGIVGVNQFSSGWGNYVRLIHSIPGVGDVSTLYAHMQAPGLPAVGSSVTKGDVIGYVGNTGNSFGAHLHWETWMTTTYGSHINPRDFMAAYGPE